MDTNEYLDMFLEESDEHIQVMSDEMLKFEQNPKNIDIVAVMFRSAHTLKGMAGTMGFESTQKLTHTIENMMDDIRNEIIEPNEQTIDFMFKGIERLELLINEIREYGSEKSGIEDLINAEKTTAKPVEIQEQSIVVDDMEKGLILDAKEQGNNVFAVDFQLREDCLLKTIRINMFFKELNNLGEVLSLKQSEEEWDKEEFNGHIDLIFATTSSKEEIEGLVYKLSEVEFIKVNPWEDSESPVLEEENQLSVEATAKEEETEPLQKPQQDNSNSPKPKPADTGKDSQSTDTHRKQTASIRVNLEKIDSLMGLFEEFIVEKGRLQNIGDRLKDKELLESLERIVRTSTEMQTSLLSMRMIPLDTIFNRFPRMVRNTSKDLGKNINFVIEGAETELDRTVVEELGDPLVHLLRNSLDHGVEMPEVRKERGKSEQGTILLRAYHKGNEAIIEIKDDGNGINVQKIKDKIIKQNVITEKEANLLTDDEIIQYIFSSGLSTADQITNLSGRGVGLDVVKTKIESLGGSVKVTTEVGVGTTFIIVLPLTLSIIQSLLVRQGEQTFAVPLANVLETIFVEEEQIRTIMEQPVLYYRNEILTTHKYSELFAKTHTDNNKYYALIIQNAFQKYALLVNEIIGQQEIVLKPLQGYAKDLQGVTGATVLGDGSVAFVLDINFFQK
ncbi:chemotaxis protein CheA [Priestia megaterium]|uniref:Chemotaxis protein CheA n=1 Tax=Priestia megaterium TaxID=1404 RepID=A0A6M6E4J6_PRIMG|nr:chemotaxis protein CheA [Priestia megaterium]QJX80514.1 chemotaxis protein CheA [Priestia megaterium]